MPKRQECNNAKITKATEYSKWQHVKMLTCRNGNDRDIEMPTCQHATRLQTTRQLSTKDVKMKRKPESHFEMAIIG